MANTLLSDIPYEPRLETDAPGTSPYEPQLEPEGLTSSSMNYGNLLGSLSLSQAFLGLSGSYSKALSDKSQANYQAQQLGFNAQVERIAAEDAIRRGTKGQIKVKRNANQIRSSRRAAIAAQGLDPNIGSAVDLDESDATQSTLDVLEIGNNAWREAWGHTVRATDLEGQQKLTESNADFQQRQTLLAGGLQALKYGTSALYFYGGGA